MKNYSTPEFEVKSFDVETVITSTSNVFSSEAGDVNGKDTVKNVD